ncbi:MAG: tRNA pseudouridine(55) synthase TruB [Candidatus Omnitrophica bacterium]|nr:tRNA pseudouridine(55) synthase TruB [Candidatus Omnitrophota bacterium]
MKLLNNPRELDGLLLVDKPKTWTSFDVCNFIKRRFHVKKVGHTGTLDPQATGVMVILLGRYTSFSKYLTEQRKTYQGTLCLGIRTDSQDCDGKIIEEQPWQHIKPEDIFETAKKFTGLLMQCPPMVSAVKHQGKRLYKLARAGQVVERQPRQVTVYRFDIEQINLPHVHFSVEVSKGTYVRTLVEDFGTALGSTAFLETLRRVGVGPYRLEDCVTVSSLEKLSTPQELKSYLVRELCESNYPFQKERASTF